MKPNMKPARPKNTKYKYKVKNAKIKTEVNYSAKMHLQSHIQTLKK